MAITVAAGDRLTSTVYNYNVPRYQVQGSDLGVTTSAADCLGGAISLEASGLYFVEMFFDHGNADVGGRDFRPSYVLTGGATQTRQYCYGVATGGTSATQATSISMASRDITTVSFGTPTSTSNRSLTRISTFITTTTAGTFKVQAASSAGTLTLYAGSFMIIHRIT